MIKYCMSNLDKILDRMMKMMMNQNKKEIENKGGQEQEKIKRKVVNSNLNR